VQLLGRSSKYAIQAIRIVLAQPAGAMTPTSTITSRLEGSPTYISKILQELVHHGVLGSRRGAGGGFYLKRPATEITLWDLLLPFEDLESESCAVDGSAVCALGNQCGMHAFWDSIRQDVLRTLRSTTLADYHKRAGDSPKVEEE